VVPFPPTAREKLMVEAACSFKGRMLTWDHNGSPDLLFPQEDRLYVDRTVATAGIHLAWKLGAERVFLLGVDGYKLKDAAGERYYFDGRPKLADCGRGVFVPEKRKERLINGVIVQDRHDFWIENMRRLRKAFDRCKVFPCKWPGAGVYNLSAKSTIDAWPKITIEEALGS
jgi:hypothetical protein